ncbi:MAG: DUF494 family protein [Desulfuromonadales bacterium]|nr:DUF494 family protein [Desulfuromonadales bacterium]MDW7757553.1 DUF494 family protein [Desulfuromonadales bacterium]
MRERVLAIVSIIAQYVLEMRDQLSDNDIVEELLAEGFEVEEIDAAFSWMNKTSFEQEGRGPASLTLPTQRIFTPEENRALSSEARGYLIKLRGLGLIGDEAQEEIIERALQMAEDEVSLKEIKTITALTLFTHSQDAWLRDADFIMEDDWAQLYH